MLNLQCGKGAYFSSKWNGLSYFEYHTILNWKEWIDWNFYFLFSMDCHWTFLGLSFLGSYWTWLMGMKWVTKESFLAHRFSNFLVSNQIKGASPLSYINETTCLELGRTWVKRSKSENFQKKKKVNSQYTDNRQERCTCKSYRNEKAIRSTDCNWN